MSCFWIFLVFFVLAAIATDQSGHSKILGDTVNILSPSNLLVVSVPRNEVLLTYELNDLSHNPSANLLLREKLLYICFTIEDVISDRIIRPFECTVIEQLPFSNIHLSTTRARHYLIKVEIAEKLFNNASALSNSISNNASTVLRSDRDSHLYRIIERFVPIRFEVRRSDFAFPTKVFDVKESDRLEVYSRYTSVEQSGPDTIASISINKYPGSSLARLDLSFTINNQFIGPSTSLTDLSICHQITKLEDNSIINAVACQPMITTNQERQLDYFLSSSLLEGEYILDLIVRVTSSETYLFGTLYPIKISVVNVLNKPPSMITEFDLFELAVYPSESVKKALFINFLLGSFHSYNALLWEACIEVNSFENIDNEALRSQIDANASIDSSIKRIIGLSLTCEAKRGSNFVLFNLPVGFYEANLYVRPLHQHIVRASPSDPDSTFVKPYLMKTVHIDVRYLEPSRATLSTEYWIPCYAWTNIGYPAATMHDPNPGVTNTGYDYIDASSEVGGEGGEGSELVAVKYLSRTKNVKVCKLASVS